MHLLSGTRGQLGRHGVGETHLQYDAAVEEQNQRDHGVASYCAAGSAGKWGTAERFAPAAHATPAFTTSAAHAPTLALAPACCSSQCWPRARSAQHAQRTAATRANCTGVARARCVWSGSAIYSTSARAMSAPLSRLLWIMIELLASSPSYNRVSKCFSIQRRRILELAINSARVQVLRARIDVVAIAPYQNSALMYDH
jgi:hypothetical protein